MTKLPHLKKYSVIIIFLNVYQSPRLFHTLNRKILEVIEFEGQVCNHGGFPSGSNSKESACSTRDPGSIPESGRSPGEGNGYPLQYSFLENSMDRRACWATVHRITKSQLSD